MRRHSSMALFKKYFINHTEYIAHPVLKPYWNDDHRKIECLDKRSACRDRKRERGKTLLHTHTCRDYHIYVVCASLLGQMFQSPTPWRHWWFNDWRNVLVTPALVKSLLAHFHHNLGSNHWLHKSGWILLLLIHWSDPFCSNFFTSRWISLCGLSNRPSQISIACSLLFSLLLPSSFISMYAVANNNKACPPNRVWYCK